MRRSPALLAAAVLAVSVTACGSSHSSTDTGRSSNPAGAAHGQAKAGAELRDVESVDQLRVLFNAKSETPRLIMLASPT
jgi:hypothetical protein